MLCPFGTRQVEELDARFREFFTDGAVRDVLGIDPVASFINPIKNFVNTFSVVLVLDEVLLY